MRRLILSAASAIALVAALAAGPLGAAAGAPYVYGCTPASLYTTSSITYTMQLSVYNGSATGTSLTLKILSRNGTILNPGSPYNSLPTTANLPARNTYMQLWATRAGAPSSTNGTIAASVRIVSAVPVVATLGHDVPTADWKPIACMPIQP